MKTIRAAILFLISSFAAYAQTTLAPMPQGFVGNPALSSAVPATVTPQQAAGLIQPYITGGGGGVPPASGWPNGKTLIDIKMAANGCAAVVANGTTDDSAALQCQIDYLYNTWGGGVLLHSGGNARIGTTVYVKGQTTIVGLGQTVSSFGAIGDTTALWFVQTGSGPKQLLNIGVYGYQSSAATKAVVRVDPNVGVVFRDATIWGGSFALATAGIDGLYENVDFNGWGATGGNIYSTGANWYVRCKIDNGAAGTTTYAFYQGATSFLAENHFVQSDFSGNFTYSVYIDDGGNHKAITVFEGSIFSAPIIIISAQWTAFIGAEIGSNSFVFNGPGDLTVSASRSFVPFTIGGSGTSRACAANQNVSC